MSLKALLVGELTQYLRIRSAVLHRTYATRSESSKEEILDITSVDTQPKFTDEVPVEEQYTVELRRNKSRLSPQDRNVLKGQRPYDDEGPAFHHYLMTWKRKMFGRYGIEGSGVPPGVAWPDKKTIEETKEYERVAYPLSLQDSWAKLAADRAEREAALQARQEDIAAKSLMTEKWEKELQRKVAKKEAELRVARERKERMIEEIRQHFGFRVDPRDERFKQMMEEKEKEDSKRRKQQKKKERSERAMARLLAESNDTLKKANIENNTDSTTAKDLS